MALQNTEYFTYDGTDIKEALEEKGFLFIINDTKGRGLMGKEAVTATVSGVDGSRFIDATFPEREITIDYTLKANDLISLREAESYLATLLVRDSEKPLSFADQEGEFKAILTGFEPDLETDIIQQGTITFLCTDPFRYKETVELTGLEFKAKEPQEITVESNYLTEARVEITLKEASKIIELTINDNVIKYEVAENVPKDAVIVFDGQALECRVNKVLKVLEVTGEYPVLKSNTNSITVNVPALLTIKYRENDI